MSLEDSCSAHIMDRNRCGQRCRVRTTEWSISSRRKQVYLCRCHRTACCIRTFGSLARPTLRRGSPDYNENNVCFEKSLVRHFTPKIKLYFFFIAVVLISLCNVLFRVNLFRKEKKKKKNSFRSKILLNNCMSGFTVTVDHWLGHCTKSFLFVFSRSFFSLLVLFAFNAKQWTFTLTLQYNIIHLMGEAIDSI